MLGVDEAGGLSQAGGGRGDCRTGELHHHARISRSRGFKTNAPIARMKCFDFCGSVCADGDIQWCVRSTSAERIDAWGLTRAVASASARGVRHLAPEPDGISVYLDGLLTAPDEYDQQTIIGGDEAVPIIALASIAAKVV